MSTNESIWNESVFDGVEGVDRQKLTQAFNSGDLADFEPLLMDLNLLSENEVIEHAHATRDNFLKKLRLGGAKSYR